MAYEFCCICYVFRSIFKTAGSVQKDEVIPVHAMKAYEKAEVQCVTHSCVICVIVLYCFVLYCIALSCTVARCHWV